MIRCVIQIEQFGKNLSLAIIPTPDQPTDLELQAWRYFEEPLRIINEAIMRKADSAESHLLEGGEEVRKLVEQRLAALEPLRRKKMEGEKGT